MLGRRHWGERTSSQVLVSNKIQPNSMTSAESLVTYTPCSSQVVATWMTMYRSSLGVGAETAAIADLSGANGAARESRGEDGEYVSAGKAEDKDKAGEEGGKNRRESPGEERRERGGGKKKRANSVEF